jgi:hypothetical protein
VMLHEAEHLPKHVINHIPISLNAKIRERIPGRHIEPRGSNHRQTFVTDEVTCRFEKLDWRDTPALKHRAEIVERRHQVAHRLY